MHLSELVVNQFKNYSQRTFTFGPKVNAITGNNGVGKTNLMDAIFYLCMTKSYFNALDTQNIRHGQSYFRLEGRFDIGAEQTDVVCKVVKGKKKEFEVDGAVLPRLSSHIGRLNVIFIAPDDSVLILGGSEERRKFIDNTLSQFDQEYLQNLIRYNKTLRQRNALLKRFAAGSAKNRSLLHSYNEALVEFGMPVFERRVALFDTFSERVGRFYNDLSGNREDVTVTYASQLANDTLRELLLMHEEKDVILQRTTAGIHKDDMRFEMNGHKVKKFSSQGQQKSFLLSLKFAQFQTILDQKGRAPILLLDDLFDKLDGERAGNLLHLISQPPFEQVFVTDTNKQRLEKIFDGISSDMRIFEIS